MSFCVDHLTEPLSKH